MDNYKITMEKPNLVNLARFPDLHTCATTGAHEKPLQTTCVVILYCWIQGRSF